MKFLSPEVAFYLLKLLYGLAWNNAGMSGLVLLSATWICSISYRIEYVGVFVFHLLFFINSWAHVVSLGLLGIALIHIYLKWLNCLHVLIFVAGQLVILIGCMIFLSLSLGATRVSTASFLAKLDSRTLWL